jgi:hypothetical protein
MNPKDEMNSDNTETLNANNNSSHGANKPPYSKPILHMLTANDTKSSGNFDPNGDADYLGS